MSVGIGSAAPGPGLPSGRRRGTARPGGDGGEPGAPAVGADGVQAGGARAAATAAIPAPIEPQPGAVVLNALRAIAQDRRVLEAEEAIRQASAELRWHGALRRRWREARAESSIRGAVAGAGVEGVVVPAEVLRSQVAAGLEVALTGDPGLDAAAGLWRAGTQVVGWMPDLVGRGRPIVPHARGLLGTLHRDITGPLAAGGRIAMAEVAAPRTDAPPREGGPAPAPTAGRLHARLDGLLALIEARQAPALVRAAVVHAEMVAVRPFSAGNAAVGRLLVRHLITADALEPTGTAVTELYAAQAPGAYAEAAAAYATGTMEGVAEWVVWQAEAILVGIEEAGRLCRAVQAGTWQAG
ncbi:Fic family protein [Actinomyces bowdenii]|uniref:Fic family protein n=2 Tax=Actinomyces bowdenii TaxID=131109 RepID=A0A853EPI0_9ACTO|nr:Fic family protein [Actinomyces bowdenii]NYS70061.1 Fic family protein [Actinomyces bowdenii]